MGRGDALHGGPGEPGDGAWRHLCDRRDPSGGPGWGAAGPGRLHRGRHHHPGGQSALDHGSDRGPRDLPRQGLPDAGACAGDRGADLGTVRRGRICAGGGNLYPETAGRGRRAGERRHRGGRRSGAGHSGGDLRRRLRRDQRFFHPRGAVQSDGGAGPGGAERWQRAADRGSHGPDHRAAPGAVLHRIRPGQQALCHGGGGYSGRGAGGPMGKDC